MKLNLLLMLLKMTLKQKLMLMMVYNQFLIGLAAKKSVQEGRPVTIKEIADEYNL